MNKSNELNLLVSEKREVAKDIFEYRFAAHDGLALPSFSPGSHIAVMTPSGANRQYSLINEGDEPRFYQIAVKLEPESRGGSQSIQVGFRKKSAYKKVLNVKMNNSRLDLQKSFR